MILSHKYKFIFFKPPKTAGTSMEENLAKICGENDIITPISKYQKKSDEQFYTHQPRNFKGYYNHITPCKVRRRVGEKIWNHYYKFTIVRNPWDLVVSRYWYENFDNMGTTWSYCINFLEDPKHYPILEKLWRKIYLRKVKNFNDFVKYYPKKYTNTRFYFDDKGKPMCDFYVRYESLEEDHKKVCEHLGLPYTELFKINTKLRKSKKHYSEYYNNETKKLVENIFSKEITFFDYRLENK